MNRLGLSLLYTVALLVVVSGIYIASRKFHFDAGYLDGAVFGDSSGYKRGLNEGFEAGFELGDSIARKELALRSSEKFNINIISEELGYPEDYIDLQGELLSKDSHKSAFSSESVDYYKVLLKSKSLFSRYRDITFKITFLDSKGKKVGDKIISTDDILYPGKSRVFEVGKNEIPSSTKEFILKLLDAEAVD